MSSLTSTSPWVNRTTFLGFLWGGEAVGTIFILMRLSIRLKAFRRLYSDDYLVIFGWFCSLSSCITWQIITPGLYDQYKLTTGELLPTPEVLKTERLLLNGSLAFQVLWNVCVYSIKGSFLLFFRRLDELYEGPRKKWAWFVAAYTFGSFVSSLSITYWKCLLSSFEYIFTQCSLPDALHFQHASFIAQCVIDVTSDSLIISIPIIMLWNVRMPLPKKIALILLFSLTVIVMGTSLARVAAVPTEHKQADVTWLYLWYNLEMSVTLLVSSLASFRQLYVTQSQRTPASGPSRTKSSWSNGTVKNMFSLKSLPTSIASKHDESAQLKTSEDDALPLSSIYVSKNVGVSTVPSSETASQRSYERPLEV